MATDDKKPGSDKMTGMGADQLRKRDTNLANASVAEKREIEKLVQVRKELDKVMSDTYTDFSEQIQSVTRLSKRLEHTKDQLAQLRTGRTYGVEKTWQSSLNTMLSNSQQGADISAASRATSTFVPAIHMARSQSTPAMETEKSKIDSMISKQAERIRVSAADTEGNRSTLPIQMSVYENLIQRSGTLKAGIQQSRKMGLDPESRYYSAMDTANKMGLTGLSSEVARGDFGGGGKINDDLTAAKREFADAAKAMATTTTKSSEDLGKLSDAFTEAHDKFKKAEAVSDEFKRQSGPSRFESAGNFMSSAGLLTMAVGNIQRFGTVDAPMTQQQQRTGFANLANQRFTDTYAASQGDMSALRRVLNNQYAQQVQRAAEMGTNAQDSATTLAVGAGEGVVARGLIGAGKNSTMPWGAAGGAAAGILESGSEVTQAATGAIDVGMGLSQNQAALQQASITKELGNAVNSISDTSSQQAFDYTKSITYATRGLGVGQVDDAAYNKKLNFRTAGKLGVDVADITGNQHASSGLGADLGSGIAGGGRREDIQAGLLDPAFVKKMGDLGIGDADIAKLVGLGKSGLGGEFAKGGFKGVSDKLTRAGQMAQVGYTDSPEQYMGELSKMSGAGGTSNNFEEILKNAVTNGMDNSKNIAEMVSGITNLSKRTAEFGVSSFGGAADMMARGYDALHADNVPTNMVADAANKAANTVENLTSGNTLTIPDVIKNQRVMAAFPKVTNPNERAQLNSLTPAVLGQIKRAYEDKTGTPEEQQARIDKVNKDFGVLGKIENVGQVNALGAANKEVVSNYIEGFGADDKMKAETAGKSWDQLTPMQQSYKNRMAQLAKAGSAHAIEAESDISTAVGRGTPQDAAGGTVGGSENIIVAATQASAKVTGDGLTNLSNVTNKGFESLGSLLKEVSLKLDPKGDAKATATAAKDFDVPMKTFGDSVVDFKGAVDALVKKFGSTTPTYKDNADPRKSKTVGVPP